MPREEEFEVDPQSWEKHQMRKDVERKGENEMTRKWEEKTGEKETSAILVSAGRE